MSPAGVAPDAVGGRRAARERALELLYEADSKDEPLSAVLASLPITPDAYAAAVLAGVEASLPDIDATIGRYARHWRLERMPAVDRAVLRLAVYELLYQHDVPTAAVINEAVELVKLYSTEDSGRFVNGVLARIADEVRADAPPAP